ncbi:MAG: DUF2798 domain-containing protein [Chromatiales bacterium]
MQLTPGQARRAFIPLNVLVMSGVMSLFMTAHHAGLGPHLLHLWMSEWVLAYLVALPFALVFSPGIRAGLARLTVAPAQRQFRKEPLP